LLGREDGLEEGWLTAADDGNDGGPQDTKLNP
jgi:hypothetical protein